MIKLFHIPTCTFYPHYFDSVEDMNQHFLFISDTKKFFSKDIKENKLRRFVDNTLVLPIEDPSTFTTIYCPLNEFEIITIF